MISNILILAFVIAGIVSIIPFDGTWKGITEDGKYTYMAAHFVSCIVLFITQKKYLLNVLIQSVSCAVILFDESILYFTSVWLIAAILFAIKII